MNQTANQKLHANKRSKNMELFTNSKNAENLSYKILLSFKKIK